MQFKAIPHQMLHMLIKIDFLVVLDLPLHNQVSVILAIMRCTACSLHYGFLPSHSATLWLIFFTVPGSREGY